MMAGDTYTIALLGDTSFGENYQIEYAAAGGLNVLDDRGYAHSLACFKAFLHDSNLAIANLETPLTDLEHSPLHGKKEYVHWSDVEKAPRALLEHNLRVMSLANNHTLDYGHEGLRQTREALIRNGISFFGAGLDAEEADRPFTRALSIGGQSLNLAVFGAFEVRRKYLFDYSFYAEADAPGVSRLKAPDLPRRIEQLKRDDANAFVIVFPHWGYNYFWRTQKQTRLAHELIDAGADLIVGHGAHMLGEIERYGGAWIVYSLGNFVFNSEGDYARAGAHPYSLVARMTLSTASGGLSRSLRLYPILSDNTLTQYQPRFVTPAEFEAVMALLVEHSPEGERLRDQAITGRDDAGLYLELALS
jgi:poly-gamma-glutamate capsule biosynthesis protein CapA/YwtB (metallophosphatase superfamily)